MKYTILPLFCRIICTSDLLEHFVGGLINGLCVYVCVCVSSSFITALLHSISFAYNNQVTYFLIELKIHKITSLSQTVTDQIHSIFSPLQQSTVPRTSTQSIHFEKEKNKIVAPSSFPVLAIHFPFSFYRPLALH